MKSSSIPKNSLPVHFFEQQSQKIKNIQADGGDVIRLDIGSPDLPPPVEVINTLIEQARKDHIHGYQSHNGVPELREAWSDWYSRLFGVELDPSRQVLPLLGSKEGIFHLPLAFITDGDAVLVPDPGYVSYTRGTVMAGGEPVPYRLRPDHNYLPNLGQIPESVARRARMMWLNYPNNPTGASASLDFFEKIVRFAEKHDILICHDAAYSQVTFKQGVAPSILQVTGADRVADIVIRIVEREALRPVEHEIIEADHAVGAENIQIHDADAGIVARVPRRRSPVLEDQQAGCTDDCARLRVPSDAGRHRP